MLVQEAAHGHGHAVAQAQVVLHVGPAQVDDAVRETGGLGDVFVVELDRRCLRGVEHLELVAQDLHLAAAQVLVGGALRARAHQAGDLQAVFAAHVLGNLEHLGPVRVAHHLHQPFAIAQVDEDDAAVVPAAVHPAAQGDDLVEVGGSDVSAVVSSHEWSPADFAAPQQNGVQG